MSGGQSPKISPPSHRQKTSRGRFGPGNPGKPFPPGHTGRPRGARDKTATVLNRLFASEAEEVGRRAVELAKEGRVGCVKLVLDQALSVGRARALPSLELPALKTGADAVAAMGRIAMAVGDGTISVEEGRGLSVMVDTFRKIYELANLEGRIKALEGTVYPRRGRPAFAPPNATSDGVGT